MKRNETTKQKEARLSAFEKDLRPTRKTSDNYKFALWPCNICTAQKPDCDNNKQHFPCLVESNDWQLTNVDDIAWTSDNSGVYCLINWQVQTDTVRIDFMTENTHNPIISFAGKSDNVRKAVGIWIDSRISQKTIMQFSAAHIAYIGSELQKADIFRIDYIQDATIPAPSDNDRARIAQNESYRSDKVCSKCGYSKCGYSSDNILMCLDCGEAWPTSDNTSPSDAELIEKTASDNKNAADTNIGKYG